MVLASSDTESQSHNPIVLGGSPVTENGTLVSGQDLADYTVLGRITASGKLAAADQDASDGRENPIGVLVHAVDASGGDKACQFYTGGTLNADLLVWDAGYTAAMQAAAFDNSPLTLVSPD